MKRMTAIWLVLMLCLSSAAATEMPVQPELLGRQAVLFCAENGQVLLDKDMHTPAHPASITKLMTALLVLESGVDLAQMTTVSHDAVYSIERDSTHIALDVGEEVTLEQMLYAMLVTSANDASNVLAEAIGGSQAAFAERMTARAAELGCLHTNFVNAHGLSHDLHYTTAYDMALITAELLKYDLLRTICCTQVYHMPPTNKQSEPRAFWNKQNILMPQSQFYDETAIAGKNGYTSKAGHTLVTAAERDGVTLIAVTLGTTTSRFDKHRDTVAMFSYGYEQFYQAALSPEEIAAAAKVAGLSPDEGAIAPTMVLLPAGRTVSDLHFAGEGEYSLTASCGAGDLLALDVPQAEPDAVSSEGGGADPEPPLAQPAIQQDGGQPSQLLLYAGMGLAAAAALLFMLFLYRMARIRRQRRALRALRLRHRAERDGRDNF